LIKELWALNDRSDHRAIRLGMAGRRRRLVSRPRERGLACSIRTGWCVSRSGQHQQHADRWRGRNSPSDRPSPRL